MSANNFIYEGKIFKEKIKIVIITLTGNKIVIGALLLYRL